MPVASTVTAQGATPVGTVFTQQLDRSHQRNYLRQHICALDSLARIPRLRRDYDGLAERIRIASFEQSYPETDNRRT